MSADLHVHTRASDGTDGPEEVVCQAKVIGLRAIAVTDHDTVEGVKPALAAGYLNGIEIIAGVELGAEYLGKELHLLGYFINIDNSNLKKKLNFLRGERKSRIFKMVQKMKNLGVQVSYEEVLAVSQSGAVGRPHLATVLKKAGVVDSTVEAFNKYIGFGCPAYVPRYKLNPAEAISIINTAGGVSVLAHPGQNNAHEMLNMLIINGLAGLEVYHPTHSREQEYFYLKLAEKHGLLITGGSDYHGRDHKTGNCLGSVTVPYSAVKKIVKKKWCNGRRT
jgi:hypothetical protein